MINFISTSVPYSNSPTFIYLYERRFSPLCVEVQKFNASNLITENGEAIKFWIVGQHNYNSGPDFFNAQVTIGDQLWAGNVEIHIRSSDWYLHRHEIDSAYDNVIFHVVWEHDAEIFRKDNSVIPTLVLKPKVSLDILDRYYQLFSQNA